VPETSTALTLVTDAGGASDETPTRPTLGSIVRRVAVSLLVACAVPATLFAGLTTLWGVWVAIGAALAWSYGAIAWRAVTGRRASGLLWLTAAVLTGRTLIALAADSTFFYFLQPILSDAVLATVFVGSLLTAKPMVARLAGDFYPMDDELHLRPGIRRLFRNLTVLWAVLCLAKAGVTLWMLLSLSLELFVVLNSATAMSVNALAAAATIAVAALVARREGLLCPRGGASAPA
jgi:uncharacterized membrane protein